MSFARAPAPGFKAADLLALDKSQMVRYLESNRRVDGGFDISNAAGVESLSKSQRCELGSKIRAAAEIATGSRSIDVDALYARLTSIQTEQDGSTELECLRPPRESPESTEMPDPDEEYIYEELSYDELIKGGGRPVCPIEVWLCILNEPAASHEPILPWLSDPDSASRGEIETVFSRQFDRWWDFRKWQWDNRGTTDGDGGFSAFLAAKRRMYKLMRIEASENLFEETTRRRWQQKPKLRLLSDDQGFPAYREAVKRRLAPHNFKRPLQLMKDPRKQTEWTTWLEYLNFEQWCLGRDAAAAEAREKQYHQAWTRLHEALRWLPKGRTESHGTKDDLDSSDVATAGAALESSQTRQPRQNTGTVALIKQLVAARADLDTAMKVINNFIRDTARYRRAEAAVYHRKNRVQWVLKEACVMETEVPQQSGTVKNNSKLESKERKKRGRSDDGVIPAEPWPKRTRRRRDGKDVIPDTGSPRRNQRIHAQSTSATRTARLSTPRKRGK